MVTVNAAAVSPPPEAATSNVSSPSAMLSSVTVIVADPAFAPTATAAVKVAGTV